uniref:Uncharacterized protein n=1 Tax=Ignisphaera aggregans TaxID=334771 RepID=A0A7C4D0Z5_9CREN
MKNKASEVSIDVKRNAEGVKLLISLSDGKNIELTLSFEEARKLGKLLLSHADAGILQINLFLRKISDIEKSIAKLDERVRVLESRLYFS